jgi:hypothetical protein
MQVDVVSSILLLLLVGIGQPFTFLVQLLLCFACSGDECLYLFLGVGFSNQEKV